MINIDELIKENLKSQNKTELRAYRNLKAEFLKAETAKNAKPMDEARQIQVLNRYLKTLEKSISDFSEASREDLAAEYGDELEVLKKLLPEPVNESQIRSELYIWAGNNKLIEMYLTEKGVYQFDAIETSKPFIPKEEMGSAIKHLKSKFPQADGKMISNIVKEYVD